MIRKIIGLYYSPAGGTKLMTEELAGDLAGMLNDCSPEEVDFECYDLARGVSDIELNEENIAVIGMPVYMGKVPLPAAKALSRVKGKDVMTLVTVSYGGRSYGNALFELQRYAENAGFKVIGLGAFILNGWALRNVKKQAALPAMMIDSAALEEFRDAVTGKIKRLTGCEVEGLRIRPAPIEAPGHMPVHLVSRISPKAAQTAQRVLASVCFSRRGSEWYL